MADNQTGAPMPANVIGIPLLPLIALRGGIVTLIRTDFLNEVVEDFLIGCGVLGISPAIGINTGTSLSDVQSMVQDGVDSATCSGAESAPVPQ